MKNQPEFQDARHGSEILLKIIQDAPHRSDMFFQIFRMLCPGATCSSKSSGCSARERNFLPNYSDAPHGRVIAEHPENLEENCAPVRSILEISSFFGSKSLLCGTSHDFERWRRESYTNPIPETSAKYRPIEPRKPSRTKYNGTDLT